MRDNIGTRQIEAMMKKDDIPQPGSEGARDEGDIHVYAGTAGHSAWFSEDLGMTWSHPNSHSGMYLEARVWALSSHAAQPESLQAGTDAGVYRWDERTARWTQLSTAPGDVWAIAHDPDDPRVLYAGTRPAGLYRSRDGGSTWQALDAPDIAQFSDVNMGPTRVTQLLFDPFVRDTLWATVEIGGIYRSDDRGNSWRLLTEGLVSGDVHGIAVTRTRDGTPRVIASTNRGLHYSEDQGETWRFREIDSPWQYTRGIVVRPDDPATVYLANGNGPPGNDGRLLRSRDGGDTWERLPLPEPLNSTVWCIALHPSNPSLLFTCTNLGQLFRSADGGDSWTRLPHEFGEIRALHWRTVPRGTRGEPHSLTRAVAPKASVQV
jgi:photosystem II stability/assembly factor-like uncharacterized protein